MAAEEPPEPPLDLGPWLEDLRTSAGLSVRALAQAVGTDRTNVKAWIGGSGMNARSLLLFLDAVGAEIKPSAPELAPRAVNAELADLRAPLVELGDLVAEAVSLLRALAEQRSHGEEPETQTGP